MNEKIVGYLLLFTGVAVMVFALFGMSQVFTGRVQPFPLFHLPALSLDLGSLVPGARVTQKTDILPADALNTLFNLFGHLLLMGFVLNFGSKLASLGAQLVRPIKVALREEK